MTNEEENENTEIESIADIRPILQALLARIEAIEGFLRNRKAQFGLYNPTAAWKWQAITAEEAEARKQRDQEGELEKKRKEGLVSKALKQPPVCVECGETMTPKEPIPRFEVGNWTIKSEDPRSWFIVFECLKSSGLGSHGTYTVFPDDSSQEIPKEKRPRHLGDGLPVGVI